MNRKFVATEGGLGMVIRDTYKRFFQIVAGVLIVGLLQAMVLPGARAEFYQFAGDYEHDFMIPEGRSLGFSFRSDFRLQQMSFDLFSHWGNSGNIMPVGQQTAFPSGPSFELPLVTLGDNIQRPGMIYDQNGPQIDTISLTQDEWQTLKYTLFYTGMFFFLTVGVYLIEKDEDEVVNRYDEGGYCGNSFDLYGDEECDSDNEKDYVDWWEEL